MTHHPRSHWELGDPVFEQIAKDEHADHFKAKARGARIRDLAQAVVMVLMGRGLLTDPDTARVLVYSVLADSLYGNQALDVPNLREKDEATR